MRVPHSIEELEKYSQGRGFFPFILKTVFFDSNYHFPPFVPPEEGFIYDATGRIYCKVGEDAHFRDGSLEGVAGYYKKREFTILHTSADLAEIL